MPSSTQVPCHSVHMLSLQGQLMAPLGTSPPQSHRVGQGECYPGDLPSCPTSVPVHYLFYPSGHPNSEHWPYPHTTGSWDQCLFFH